MQIQTLVQDIYKTVQRKDNWFTDDLAREFSDNISKRLQQQLSEAKEPPRLRLSQMGPMCPCALWHSIHKPELATALPPWAEIKYSYGHMIEALALVLAKASGHSVVGEQDAIVVDGVTGHRDCVIDGCVVDVKSSNSRSFIKFKDKSIKENDTFGYLDQLDGYLVGSSEDPLVVVKDRAYIFAVDMTLGHMVLYEHVLREENIRRRIKDYKGVVARSNPPECTCSTVPDGKSGNITLDTRASYSAFKYCCFPSLRTFLYADGPRYLTTVVRKPDVVEVDKHGKIVHS